MSEKREVIWSTYTYIGFSFLALFAMFASPTFPQRAGMGSVTFFIIGTLNLLNLNIYYKTGIPKIRKWLFASLFFIWAAFSILALYSYKVIHVEN